MKNHVINHVYVRNIEYNHFSQCSQEFSIIWSVAFALTTDYSYIFVFKKLVQKNKQQLCPAPEARRWVPVWLCGFRAEYKLCKYQEREGLSFKLTNELTRCDGN